MRVPRVLAWLLLVMGMFTAGLLRQFHDLTPRSPFLAPAVGSLLFACVVFLALVAVRERQIGAAPGPGIRLGSLTPFLLMLLFEKWFSSSLYQPVFAWLSRPGLDPDAGDAWFRALCGAGLLAVVLVASRFSAPAASWTARRVAPSRIPAGLATALTAILATYLLLAALSIAAGSRVSVGAPSTAGPLLTVVFGQAGIALAEETYFRGLLLGELSRLMPRLGVRPHAARRWIALLATSAMFAMEHLGGASGWSQAVRELVFTGALGLLFGMLVIVTANLWPAVVLHAWIDWLLVGAAPRLTHGGTGTGMPAGVYIFLALIGTFVIVFFSSRRGARGPAGRGGSATGAKG